MLKSSPYMTRLKALYIIVCFIPNMAAFFTLLNYRDPLFRHPCRGQCRPNFTSIRSARSDGPWSTSVAWQFREISCKLCLWVLLSDRLEWVSETWWPDHCTSISLAVPSSQTRPSPAA
jgi:hypothetical protein